MDKINIEKTIKDIIYKTVKDFIDESAVYNIGVEDPLQELGIDSVSFIKIVVELEKEFSIKFEIEDMELTKLNSLNKIIDYIINKTK